MEIGSVIQDLKVEDLSRSGQKSKIWCRVIKINKPKNKNKVNSATCIKWCNEIFDYK